MAACSMLEIPPESFWQMGLSELYVLIEGWCKYTGGEVGALPPTREELEELMSKFREI